MSLNKSQQEAVDILQGQVMVVSCPGSGKTTVIVERTRNLVLSGVSESNILVVTFTKEAATQMKERYEAKYGMCNILFGTIHSICYRMLSEAYGLNKNNILKETEKWKFFYNNLKNNVNTDNLEDYIKDLMGEIGFVKNKDIPVNNYTPERIGKELFIHAFKAYETYKKSVGKIDFDDMLIMAREYLFDNPEQLEKWKRRYQYIMIDEYQDTNKIQADIFYSLAGINGNICVVGDPDQSVYRFRAAEPKIFLNFPKDYPNCHTIYMGTNYRSGKEIVERAGKLIQHNKNRFKQEFEAAKKEDGSVKVKVYESDKAQSKCIFDELKKMQENGENLKEVAVLYRNNYQNKFLISALMKAKVPFYTTEAPKDYHSGYMFKDIMAYYRLAENKGMRGDVQRVLNKPNRYLATKAFAGCGNSKDEMLRIAQGLTKNSSNAYVKVMELFSDINALKSKTPGEFMRSLVGIIGYKNYVKSFCDFSKKDYEEEMNTLHILMEEAADFRTMEEWQDFATKFAEELTEKRQDKKKEGICLSTFHSSKGLEWDKVYIIDSADDITPSKKSKDDEDLEEERRLFYVAVTRARKEVLISYNTESLPTRYIQEMGISKKERIQSYKETRGGIPKVTSRTKASPKYYAVKFKDSKRVNKIFDTWFGSEGCKEYVDGHNCIYKSFKSEREAERYLR